ncbi:MAG: alpha/beta hydrolase [Succinivibrio sp.]|nr:alpha/beta hydrolase [Succinivibrio sp.]
MKASMKKLALLLPVCLFSFSVMAADLSQYSDGESELTQNYIKATMNSYFSGAKKNKSIPFKAVSGWVQEKWQQNTLPMEKLNRNLHKNGRVILQLHGGGYVLGLNDNYRKFAQKQADSIKADTVYMFDYRHAPQHTYPAALEDAVIAYKKVLADGNNPENIILMGDSAGGNLALVLGVRLRELNLPQPRAMILMSPWTAMNDVPSHLNNQTKDAVLGKNTPLFPEMYKLSYAKGYNSADPKLSPLYADLSGLPPMLIQTGSYELLYSDSVLLNKAADKAGVKNKLSVYNGMPHDFMLVLPELPQTIAAFEEMGAFADEIFGSN